MRYGVVLTIVWDMALCEIWCGTDYGMGHHTV